MVTVLCPPPVVIGSAARVQAAASPSPRDDSTAHAARLFGPVEDEREGGWPRTSRMPSPNGVTETAGCQAGRPAETPRKSRGLVPSALTRLSCRVPASDSNCPSSRGLGRGWLPVSIQSDGHRMTNLISSRTLLPLMAALRGRPSRRSSPVGWQPTRAGIEPLLGKTGPYWPRAGMPLVGHPARTPGRNRFRSWLESSLDRNGACRAAASADAPCRLSRRCSVEFPAGTVQTIRSAGTTRLWVRPRRSERTQALVDAA